MNENIISINIPNIISIMIMVIVGGAVLTFVSRMTKNMMMKREATAEE